MKTRPCFDHTPACRLPIKLKQRVHTLRVRVRYIRLQDSFAFLKDVDVDKMFDGGSSTYLSSLFCSFEI
jgi:hypothetical protein